MVSVAANLAARGIKSVPPWFWYASAGLIALYVIKKGGVNQAINDAVAGVVNQAGEAVISAGSGVVLGIGDIVGIPRTDAEKCDDCKRNGEVFCASKFCAAKDFLQWLASGQPTGGASGSW